MILKSFSKINLSLSVNRKLPKSIITKAYNSYKYFYDTLISSQ